MTPAELDTFMENAKKEGEALFGKTFLNPIALKSVTDSQKIKSLESRIEDLELIVDSLSKKFTAHEDVHFYRERDQY